MGPLGNTVHRQESLEEGDDRVLSFGIFFFVVCAFFSFSPPLPPLSLSLVKFLYFSNACIKSLVTLRTNTPVRRAETASAVVLSLRVGSSPVSNFVPFFKAEAAFVVWGITL